MISGKLAELALTAERFSCGLRRHHCEVDGHRWHYLEGGSDTAETLVLLHGFGADKDNWNRFAGALRRDYHILVPDRVTHQRFVELGHAGERVHVCGNPHFDHVCTVARGLDQRGLGEVRRAVVPGAPDDLPVVVFSAEVSDGPEPFRYYRDADYTLTGRGGSDRRTDIVLEEVLDALAGIEPRPYVVLRPHPKNLDDEFDAYAAEVGEISRAGSSTEAVFAADVVVGMTSMMLLEAALMGRPALSVLPRRREAEWLTSIAMGLTPAVFTRRELCRKLRTAIADSASWGATPAEEVIEFDALERMADVLAGLVKDGPDGTAE